MCTKAFIYKDTSQYAQDGCYRMLYQQQLLPVHAETFFKIYFPRIFSFLTKVQKTEGAPSITPPVSDGIILKYFQKLSK